MRAIFEISLKRGWAALAERCLKFCQMIEHRMWGTQTELRQFKVPNVRDKIPMSVLKQVERKGLTVEKLFPLDAHQIGAAIDSNNAQLRKNVHTLGKIKKKKERNKFNLITFKTTLCYMTVDCL